MEDEASRLEFKRTFFLQNLTDVKREWYEHDAYSQKLRLWFLALWFGTLAVYMKGEAKGINISFVLVIITLIFSAIDIYYAIGSQYMLQRISKMEHWLMSSSDGQILSQETPLAGVVHGPIETSLLAAVSHPYIWCLYGSLFILSLLAQRILGQAAA